MHRIKEAKTVYHFIKVGTRKTKSGELRDVTVPIRLGYKVEFDNGIKVQVGDKTIVGQGTVVFHSLRHNSITISRPPTATYHRSGSVIVDNAGVVQWNKASKTKGMKPAEFERRYGADFVKAVYDGFELAQLEDEEKAAA